MRGPRCIMSRDRFLDRGSDSQIGQDLSAYLFVRRRDKLPGLGYSFIERALSRPTVRRQFSEIPTSIFTKRRSNEPQ